MAWSQASIIRTFGYECYRTRRKNRKGQQAGSVTTRHIPSLILGLGLGYQLRFAKGVVDLKQLLPILKKPDGFILLCYVNGHEDEDWFDLACDVDEAPKGPAGHCVRVRKVADVEVETTDGLTGNKKTAPRQRVVYVMDPDGVGQNGALWWRDLEMKRVYAIAGWDKPKRTWLP